MERELFQVTQDTRSAFGSTIELYSRVARNADNLGLSQKNLLALTKATNQAIRIGGSTTQEASAGVIQFSQALASGQLRGDELRSVMENLPRLAQALADGLGITIGELREMSEQGKLTADVVSQALLSQKDVIEDEFSELPKTVGQAFTQLINEVQLAIADADTSGLVQSIDDFRNILSDQDTLNSLTFFAQAIVSTFGFATSVLADFVDVAGDIGVQIARLGSGPLDAISEIDRKIERLEDNKNKPLSIGLFDEDFGTGIIDAERLLKELRAEREQLARDAGLFIAEELEQETNKSEEQLRFEKQLQSEIRRERALTAQLDKELQDASIDRAKQTAKVRIKAENDVLKEKKKALREGVKAEEDAADKIEEIQDEIRDIQLGVEEKIRERNRSGLDDDEKEFDIKLEAFSKLREARGALDQGDTEAAALAAQRVQELSDRLSSITDSNFLLRQGTDLLIQSKQDEIAATEEARQKQAEANAQLERDIAAQTTLIANLKQELTQIGEIDPSIEIKDNIDQVKARIEELKQSLASIPSADVNVPSPTPGFSRGTILPGYGGGDRRFSLLEDGEAVIRKEAVRHYGRRLIEGINARKVRGFRTGGIIEGVASSIPLFPPPSGQATPTPINLVLPGLGEFPVTADQDVADRLVSLISMESLKSGRRP
jgi:tape measure domain-containing protein